VVEIPLAARLRPNSLTEVIGQSRALIENGPLARLISGDQSGSWPSVILWGPPGSGKTTIARLIGNNEKVHFIELSAVSASVAQVRELIAKAKELKNLYDRPTVLFLDEVHRFSKSQQDSLLSAVESGIITLIAATTENPSFSVIKPLISRSVVVKLERLNDGDVLSILNRALESDSGLPNATFETEALKYLAKISSGDARRALTLMEAAANSSSNSVSLESAKLAAQSTIVYDQAGDEHYDTISAFIKSVRGSDADSALHYLARMIAGGEDPRFIARRLMILASEDVGLADPHALVLAEATAGTVERIGMPEGRIPLAQLTIYLALAPKSNRAYQAINMAMAAVEAANTKPVPAALRSTGAVGYKYPHDDPRGVLPQTYRYGDEIFYHPSDHGFEAELAKRVEMIRKILAR
jgi:putative ATPase